MNANQASIQASISPELQAAVVARGGINPTFEFVIPFDPSGGVGATVGDVNQSNVYGLWVSDGSRRRLRQSGFESAVQECDNISECPNKTLFLEYSTWKGYPVWRSNASTLPVSWPRTNYGRERFIGSSRNVLMAGMLLHQVHASASDIEAQASLFCSGFHGPLVHASASDIEAQTSFHCSSPHGPLVRASALDIEAQTSFHCSSPHGPLVDACLGSSTAASSTDASESGSDQLTDSSSLPRIGIDPSFSTKSVLYNKDVASDAEDWYNTTAGSGETNSFGFPYGYKSESLKGFPDGYPFLFDINLNQARVQHMLKYLKEGSYLISSATKTMTAQVSSYNRDLQIYGYLKIVFSWSDNGLINANFLVRTLEYRDYTSTGLQFGVMMTRLAVDLALIQKQTTFSSVQALEYRDYTSTGLQFGEMMTRLAVDLALIGMVILYVISAAWDIWKSLMHQRRTQDRLKVQDDYLETFACCVSELISHLISHLLLSCAALRLKRLKVQDDNPEFTTIGDITARDMTGTGLKELPDFSAHALDPNDRGPKAARYQTHMSSAWMFYEIALCTIMITALALLYTYAVTLASVMPDQRRYEVYDASSFAPAQPLLLSRLDELTAQATESAGLTAINLADAAGISVAEDIANIGAALTSIPSPGKADRWQLEENTVGMDSSAEMMTTMDQMSTYLLLYTMFQGIALCMIMIRLMTHTSFQARLSVITGTIARAMPDLICFGYVVMVIGLPLTVLMVIIYGPAYQGSATAEEALIGIFIDMLLGIQDQDNSMIRVMQANMLHGEFIYDGILAGLLYFLRSLFLIFLLSFLLAMLRWPYTELTLGARGLPGVPQDVARLTKWFFQSIVGAPSNSKMAKLIQKALDVDTTGVLVRMARAASYMYPPKNFFSLKKDSRKPPPGPGAAANMSLATMAMASVKSKREDTVKKDSRRPLPGPDAAANMSLATIAMASVKAKREDTVKVGFVFMYYPILYRAGPGAAANMSLATIAMPSVKAKREVTVKKNMSLATVAMASVKAKREDTVKLDDNQTLDAEGLGNIFQAMNRGKSISAALGYDSPLHRTPLHRTPTQPNPILTGRQQDPGCRGPRQNLPGHEPLDGNKTLDAHGMINIFQAMTRKRLDDNKTLDAQGMTNILQAMSRGKSISAALGYNLHEGLRDRRASAPGTGAHVGDSSPRPDGTGLLNGPPPLTDRQIYPGMAKKWRSGVALALSTQQPAEFSSEPGAGVQPSHVRAGGAHPEWSEDSRTASSRFSEAGTSVAGGQDLGPHLRDSSLTAGPRRVSRFSEAGASVDGHQDPGPHPRDNSLTAGPRRASVAFQIPAPGGDSGCLRIESCSSAGSGHGPSQGPSGNGANEAFSGRAMRRESMREGMSKAWKRIGSRKERPSSAGSGRALSWQGTGLRSFTSRFASRLPSWKQRQAEPMDEDQLLQLASQQLLAQLGEGSRKDTGRVLQLNQPFGSFKGNKRWDFLNTMAAGEAPGLTIIDATSVKMAKARILATTKRGRSVKLRATLGLADGVCVLQKRVVRACSGEAGVGGDASG
eukprot:gene3743-13802_t